jgi:hypothetical protein
MILYAHSNGAVNEWDKPGYIGKISVYRSNDEHVVPAEELHLNQRSFFSNYWYWKRRSRETADSALPRRRQQYESSVVDSQTTRSGTFTRHPKRLKEQHTNGKLKHVFAEFSAYFQSNVHRDV